MPSFRHLMSRIGSRARILAALRGAMLCCSIAAAVAAAPAADEIPGLPEVAVIDAALEAGGMQQATNIEQYRRRIQGEVDRVVAELDLKKPSIRGAKRLHRILHREYLRHYDVEADRLDLLLDHGRYNCLSGTLFYGLITRRLGYDPWVIRLPGHVLLRLEIGDRSVDVETTRANGFNFSYFSALRPAGDGRIQSRQPLEWPGSTARSRQLAGERWRLTLEAAVGYAWINRAWRALEQGLAGEATDYVMEARRYLTDLQSEEEEVRVILVRAFGLAFDKGAFDEAYRIATAEASIFRERTRSRDRLLAAALKRIELLCESLQPRRALEVLDDVATIHRSNVDQARIERRTAPLVVVAAVRLGDFTLAAEVTNRLELYEPDGVEVRRLRRWLEQRRDGSLLDSPSSGR